uniref:DNA replication and repair protein RecF n=1 Tax=Cyanothece sp. (strain PCC 7425 / ATCC 29141) TaxID=395961 RepID=RECF_CYAP4|nr:RecName: Full=DNA replication and repair protein RecF [Cyanothece sp. PCC 7425]
MYLKSLQLRYFRNYREQVIDFAAPKTILVGQNAQGKSNLLEAVELLSTLRSHRSHRDRELVLSGQENGQIIATIERDSGPLDLTLNLRSNGRRTLMVNSEPVRRHLDFLGHLNAVEFSSLDLDLVRGTPAERRNWLDNVLIQLEPFYAHLLQQYNHVLRQRNAFLKSYQREGSLDHTELKLWDQQLASTGTRLTRRRQRLLVRLAPLATHWHQAISGKNEDLQVHYAPNVPLEGDEPEAIYQAFLEKLQQKAIAEQHQGTSLVGPHRDEVELIINQTPARQYGSQGQQRTLVLALKLAELKLIEEVIGEPPLLLLDDVLAELDLQRQNQLLETIQDRFQTLITTTHLGAFDAQWLKSAQILEVAGGVIFNSNHCDRR